MKKSSSVLVLLLLSLASLAAQTAVPAGLVWEALGDTVVITKYTGTGVSVAIPAHIDGKQVRAIGDWAFSLNTNLTSVSLPDGLTGIGAGAFFMCSNLTSVNIPDSVITISERAFSYCRSLSSVSIPESVSSIGIWAFSWCSSLTSVSISRHVSSIGDYAFAACGNLSAAAAADLKGWYGAQLLHFISTEVAVVDETIERSPSDGVTVLTFTGKDRVVVLTFPDEFDKEESAAIVELLSSTLDMVPQPNVETPSPQAIAAFARSRSAQHIIRGNIAQYEEQHVLIMSVTKTDSLELLGGTVLSFADTNELQEKAPLITQNIETAAQRDTGSLPKLGIVPLEVTPDMPKTAEAEALFQVLSINIANSEQYAVYPQNSSLETFLMEQKDLNTRLPSEETIDRALAINAESIGLGEQAMRIWITNVDTGTRLEERRVNYGRVDDGIAAIETASTAITGVRTLTPDLVGAAKDVDISVTLIWSNRNDLDLYVSNPYGERIFFVNPRDSSGGWLDVDMNVDGEAVAPIEHAFWREAPYGQYTVTVGFYGYHERDSVPTEFKVEVTNGSDFHTFNGIISSDGSRTWMEVCTFENGDEGIQVGTSNDALKYQYRKL
ncbi:leucine-rich repeat protein [Breznakiellaceae bacterium SP9]